jgi:hypothetical protein
VLLRLGDNPPAGNGIEQAARQRGVPLTCIALKEPNVLAAYERCLVLVRPDGHVAWRSDVMPDDPLAVVDRVRGAA